MKKKLSAVVLVIGLLGNSNAQAWEATFIAQGLQLVQETATAASAAVIEAKTQIMQEVTSWGWVEQIKNAVQTVKDIVAAKEKLTDEITSVMNEVTNIENSMQSLWASTPNKEVDYEYAQRNPGELITGVTCSGSSCSVSGLGYTGTATDKSSRDMRDELKIDPSDVGVMPTSLGSALTGLGISVSGITGVLSGGKKTIKQISDEASEKNAQEIAVINAMAYEAFAQASNRVASIEILKGRLKPASQGGTGPEGEANSLKYIADVQGRIQAEQALLVNDQNKLAALAVLQQSQRDMYEQRKKEIAKYSTSGDRKDTFEQKAIHVGVLAVTKGAYSLMEDAYDAD